MAGKTMLTLLKSKRDNLIDRWIDDKRADRTKLLVQIMDLDEDIADVVKEQRRPSRRNFN